jgi:hypothetical protein
VRHLPGVATLRALAYPRRSALPQPTMYSASFRHDTKGIARTSGVHQPGGLGHSRQFLDRVPARNDFTIVGPPHVEECPSSCSATGFALQEHQDPLLFDQLRGRVTPGDANRQRGRGSSRRGSYRHQTNERPFRSWAPPAARSPAVRGRSVPIDCPGDRLLVNCRQ